MKGSIGDTSENSKLQEPRRLVMIWVVPTLRPKPFRLTYELSKAERLLQLEDDI